jgi:hypothetical protein
MDRSRITVAVLLFTLGAGTFAQSPAHDSRYPAHWWVAVSKDGAPSWEILPQEAGPGEVILSKRHELGLLSNFAPTPFHVSRQALCEPRRLLANDVVSGRP